MMLQKILERLNGHAADSIAIAEALGQLERDEAAAAAALSAAQERRRQALLDDVDDKTLDRVEREVERAKIRLEKLKTAAPELRQRFADAKAAEHQRVRNAALLEYCATVEAALDIYERADVAFFQVRDVWRKHEHLLASAIQPQIPQMILGEGGGLQWAKATRGLIASIRARVEGKPITKPAPPPAPVQMDAKPPHAQPNPAQRSGLPRGPVRSDDSHMGSNPDLLRAKRTPDDLSPLETAEARVKVQSDGWSPANDRPQCHRNQIIKMPRDAAKRASENGFVQILEMHVDRTAVEGGAWESDQRRVDPRTGNVT